MASTGQSCTFDPLDAVGALLHTPRITPSSGVLLHLQRFGHVGFGTASAPQFINRRLL
jgi:hypothetical protein